MKTNKFNQATAERYAESVIKRPDLVELDSELMAIAEQQARASHEGWMAGKALQGYVYGEETNDDPEKGPLTNPLMVPFDALSTEVKNSNIANAIAVISIMRDKGCAFVGFTQNILYPLAEQIHDAWCIEKINQGWVWGEVTDKANKIHRDLIPFDVLASTPELQGDIVYDVDTARQIIIKMIADNDIFPVIQNLAKFKMAGRVVS